jgi:Carboxypeptidase regulatory-like domain/TonB dependent receptor
MKSFRLNILAAALACAFAPIALAQDTSSAMTGRITGADGNPVAGATIEIVHTPSGTRKTVTTDAQGRYNSKGLRVGGPYSVSVLKDGVEGAKQENVTLKLGETSTVNVALQDEATLDEVVVSAARLDTTFDPNKMGASSVVTRDMIESLPSISRSISDYIRLDPRITQVDKGTGAISAAGQNNRYNSVTIDGVPTNDEFGLNAGGLPSLNQPISLDTIEELSIGTAGFDVTTNDATGANINAITKSGTNAFKGTLTTTYREKSWVRKTNDLNQRFNGFDNELTYALTLGGPILQDRLFFFVAAEKFSADNPAPTLNQAVRNGVVSPIFTDSQIGQIRTAATGYGFTLGESTISGITNEDTKLLAKVDWNINDAHRVSVRWNKTKGETLEVRDNNATTLSFSDHWFTRFQDNEAYVLNAYSDWADNFTTEFSLSSSDYQALVPLQSNTPEVTITEGTNRFLLGGERFRHANRLEVGTTTGLLSGNLFIGDHTLKGGLDFKRTDVFNLFLESNFGRYEFSSIANFQAGNVFRYTLRYPTTGPRTSPESAAADWTVDNWGLFLQDTWVVSPNLTVNYGVRADLPKIDDVPQFNALLASAPLPPGLNSFRPLGGLGLNNTGTPDGNNVIQPRFGFNYTFDSDRKMQLRGGVGLFTGSPPGVWLSNNYSETGTLITEFVTQVPTTPIVADPRNVPIPTGTGTLPRSTVNLLDDDFKMPTVWKGNLAFEMELPWYGLVGGAELLMTDTENGIFYENLNLGSPGNNASGRLPDGRIHYWQSTAGTNFTATSGVPAAGAGRRFSEAANFFDVLLLRNTNKGKAQNLTLSLEKPMEEAWGGKLAYTFGRATEPNPGFEARAITNWSQNPSFNANEEIDSPSSFEIRDRLTLSLNYRHAFFNELYTKVGLFGEGRTGRNFSYVFANDANGDNANANNDLFYVPRDRSDVSFRDIAGGLTAQQQADLFWNYIESNEYLNSRRGQSTGRNASRNPWITQFDLHIGQDLPTLGNVKPEIYLDIANVGNLISKKYGLIDETPNPLVVGVAQFAGVEANPTGGSRYIYRFTQNPSEFVRQDGRAQSRWAAQIGLRLSF